MGINTHVLDNGEIVSGGVDLFLAGIKRSVGSNVKIGVHAWSDGTKQATDYPRGSKEHQQYIKYYQDIGFSKKKPKISITIP